MAKTNRAVLARAREILTEVGWLKGQLYRDKKGRFAGPGPLTVDDISGACVMGALSLAVRELRTHSHAGRKALYGVVGRDLVEWNDDPFTEREDVILALKHAESQE